MDKLKLREQLKRYLPEESDASIEHILGVALRGERALTRFNIEVLWVSHMDCPPRGIGCWVFWVSYPDVSALDNLTTELREVDSTFDLANNSLYGAKIFFHYRLES